MVETVAKATKALWTIGRGGKDAFEVSFLSLEREAGNEVRKTAKRLDLREAEDWDDRENEEDGDEGLIKGREERRSERGC